jgi:hypothetical protein
MNSMTINKLMMTLCQRRDALRDNLVVCEYALLKTRHLLHQISKKRKLTRLAVSYLMISQFYIVSLDIDSSNCGTILHSPFIETDFHVHAPVEIVTTTLFSISLLIASIAATLRLPVGTIHPIYPCEITTHASISAANNHMQSLALTPMFVSLIETNDVSILEVVDHGIYCADENESLSGCAIEGVWETVFTTNMSYSRALELLQDSLLLLCKAAGMSEHNLAPHEYMLVNMKLLQEHIARQLFKLEENYEDDFP